MRGKSIDQVTAVDIQLLISDGASEDRRLEYKADIPVSPEAQKAHAKSGAEGRPVDRSWIQGKSIADFGRDALAEEAVAFANADGGTIVLGMDETDDPPPRAKGINALPDVAGLERRLRDIMASCVEPRLPYVAVRAIPTQADGAGVVLIEISASALGPHWVRKTRKPTIRRDDRCDSLTMPEIHDMVLRNARGTETAAQKAGELREDFERQFIEHLFRQIPYQIIGTTVGRVDQWLQELQHSALGAQVVVMPHYDLSLPRLEKFDGLMPSANAISLETQDGNRKTYWIDAYTFAVNHQNKMLGGVYAIQEGEFYRTVKAFRDGRIVVSFMQHRPPRSCTCSADIIVGLSAFALGVFDKLRKTSSYPEAPAQFYLDIFTRRQVGVGIYEGFGFPSTHGQLEEHVPFPSYTLGSSDDISTIINEVAYDLMNAGGMSASYLPKVIWDDKT